MTPTIEAVGLTQGYGRQVVVSNIDFSLDSGIYGLLGPNGAGKSTLLRTLATVMPPLRGEMRICGNRVRSMSDVRLTRRSIGYLPQHFGYFGEFTVYEFVRYCAWLRELPMSEARKATLRAISEVHLADRKDTKLKKLSGGMLRRCGLAQAIVGDPPILLLDEPTVGLDPAQRLEFRELIRSLKNATVILSTHLVEDVAAVCDEAIVMAEGRFLFRGPPTALAEAATPGAAGDTALERGYTAVLKGSAVAA